DKADPDLPNALLVPLGSLTFDVTDINLVVRCTSAPPVSTEPVQISRLLVVITTNEEKALPAAFLRRCIVHRLEHPGADRLVAIARMHFTRPPVRHFSNTDEAIARTLADKVE